MENAAIKIQSVFRGYLFRKHFQKEICKYIIFLLNNKCYEKLLQNCYFRILQVLKQFPPAKNEYKFIYGKLIEEIIIETLNKIHTTKCLDDTHTSGSEYKYDCTFLLLRFSIKACKNVSNIIVINKNSAKKHYIQNMNFIVCYILEGKLCIFPCHVIKKENIVLSDSKIELKAKILKDHLCPWTIRFPPLSKKQRKYINKLNEVDVYKHLKTFLK